RKIRRASGRVDSVGMRPPGRFHKCTGGMQPRASVNNTDSPRRHKVRTKGHNVEIEKVFCSLCGASCGLCAVVGSFSMPTVAEVAAFLERFAPAATAAEWDNVGLLLGDGSDTADRVMTCLTVSPDVVAEAVRERANLIVSHHPILFRVVKKLTAGT